MAQIELKIEVNVLFDAINVYRLVELSKGGEERIR